MCIMDEDRTADVIYLDFAKAFFTLSTTDFCGRKWSPSAWVPSSCGGLQKALGPGRNSTRGGGLSGAIPMRSVVPQTSVLGPLLFLLFVNDLPDALDALTLLFVDDIKMVTPRTQDLNHHSSLIAPLDFSQKWGLPINPAKWNYFTREIPLRLSFFPMTWHPHPSIQISQGSRGLDR